MFYKLFIKIRELYFNSLGSYLIKDAPKDILKAAKDLNIPDIYLEELVSIKYSYKSLEGEKLYAVTFPFPVTCLEVLVELNKLGLVPASLPEMLIFIKNFRGLKKHTPIVLLGGFSNPDDFIINSSLAILYVGGKFENPGEVEASEIYEGLPFRSGVIFLAKETPLNLLQTIAELS